MKERIESCANALFLVVESLCKVILVFMIGAVAAQVITRVLGSNIKWCEEVMLFLLDALMFLLMPIGIKEDLHIRVEVLAKNFPQRIRVALVYFSNIVLLVISVCMMYYGNVLMKKTNSVFTITGIPRKYLYLITIISGVLCTIVVVLKLFGMFQTEATTNYINGVETDHES
ncbi:MAG: TRAP transporter small permease subunit [Clostridia bacterium]|nr:TRAP transporter small permease subunit [Clostridia bacterium]